MTKFYRFCRGVCKFLFHIAYKTEVYGSENLPESGGYILASNHKSFFDSPLIGMTINKQLFFMAKEYLFNIKVLGAIIRKLGAFPVSKGNGEQAILTAIDVLNKGNILGIFPEGTRIKTDQLGRFKSGVIVIAAQTGADVIPVALRYERRHFRRNKAIVSYGTLIKNSDLGIDMSAPRTIRNASTLIKGEIAKQLEDIKCK